MKKNMLIAIIIATFFSCTELLDELEGLNVGSDNLTDSLQNVIDSLVVTDSINNIEDSIDDDVTVIPDSESAGLTYSAQELDIWRSRVKSGSYTGQWTRITNNANGFLSNPSAEIWSHNLRPVTEQSTSGRDEAIPVYEGVKMRDAAFYYLITGDIKYGEKVKETLLQQIKEPSVDFSDRGVWPLNIGSQPPMFQVPEWLLTALFTYDYTYDLYSESEKKEIDTWFHNAGKYFKDNLDKMLDKLFVNRYGGDYTLSSYTQSLNSANESKYIFYTHVGGHKVAPVAAWNYQNRQASQVRFLAYAGFLVNDNELINSAKITVKEFVRFWAYSDGLTTEFERGFQQSRPEAGFAYTYSTLEALLNVADLFARNGDLSLFQYETSEGWYGTNGGSKSLWKVGTTLCQIKNGDYYDNLTKSDKIYSVAKSSQYVIDGYDPVDTYSGKPMIYAKEFYLAQYNIYFNDSYIKSSYQDCLNTGGVQIASSGPHNNDQGIGGIFPSKSLMYWDMEGRVSPYSGIE